MKTEEKTKVSEVGFEPGSFRSCVEHSIHYATETPLIPDVLLVLVAPKYINRNGTTTLQSRFDLNKIVLLSGPRCFHLVQKGNLRIEIHFAAPLGQTVNVVVYGESEAVLEIDKNRNIIYDH